MKFLILLIKILIDKNFPEMFMVEMGIIYGSSLK